MINMKRYARFLAAATALSIAASFNYTWSGTVIPAGYSETTIADEYAAYNTELFNLLLDKKSLMDGKNHYSRAFATTFDMILSKASSVKSKQDLAQLKKRLLSGPAPKPRALTQTSTGNNYFYYEICQAHACNVTNLGLLFSPKSKSMFGRISIDGQYEYLGAPSDSEKALLAALKFDSEK